ncbi:MAG: UTP--glucose-1-phosphate uridylyltransferase [Chloroflexota bacterium]
MSELINIITSQDPKIRNQSLDGYCREAMLEQLIQDTAELDNFRRASTNLYERVRALFFLYAIYRFHLPAKLTSSSIEAKTEKNKIPFEGVKLLLKRRFEEAIDTFLAAQSANGPSSSISSALAESYHNLGFQTLADQVRRSVRSSRGNQWMFRIGHPADHPLQIQPALCQLSADGLFPLLHEQTPVRMDLTHSSWSDIFFLGMDFPEGARVINTSVNLAVRGADGSDAPHPPKPPIEAFFRVIDESVIRLTSVDLNATATITSLAEMFDYARDYLGLLKGAVIASGVIPAGIEGAHQPLSDLLNKLVGPGMGFEVVSQVNGIPKGSRLAVSTNLLASLISVCMRATGQTQSLTGPLQESERRIVASRAILGEWLAGSGGGWQDSGGVWPGMKLITATQPTENDPEYGVSRGRLLPTHKIFDRQEVSAETRQKLTDSLVLVHGGMAQDVGPVLEMVTEKYLLRSEKEWEARQEAIALLDEMVELLANGDIKAIGEATTRNFFRPITTIIPWATNLFTERVIEKARAKYGDQFWGFWMLGGMAGGGMGFLFDPAVKPQAQRDVQAMMLEAKSELQDGVPFAMDPVVYDFSINEVGTAATLKQSSGALLSPAYYTLILPDLIKRDSRDLSDSRAAELNAFRTDPTLSKMAPMLFDRLLPKSSEEKGETQSLESLLSENGFDQQQHEQIRSDLISGRIGIAQNRLPVNAQINDVEPADVIQPEQVDKEHLTSLGEQALRDGNVAIVSLAGGAGSRWTKGAGVVKSLNPFVKLGGKHRNFVEIHLAKSRKTAEVYGQTVPHIITTSYLTHRPISDFKGKISPDALGQVDVRLSPGRSVGLRLIPTARDLRYAWEEMPQQLLDEQAQKMQDSAHAALIGWAQGAGEGSDYTDNLPAQCMHPVGHWFEVPNMLLNGTLAKLLSDRPKLTTLMIHNIDTVGANLDPLMLGIHLQEDGALTTEVIHRCIEDTGGGLARIDGQLRLIEGLALPREEVEFDLSFYNSSTTWVNIDKLLTLFELSRQTLSDTKFVAEKVRKMAAKMPTYITLKDVKKRWGKGQEDIFPITQWEKLWGDMTALPDVQASFVVVGRERGQQIKEVSQLDGWLRDGSAAYVDNLCAWESAGS